MPMTSLEKIMKLNDFDLLLLKAIGDGRKSTKEIMQAVSKTAPVLVGRNFNRKSWFSQRLTFLVDLGLVTRIKDACCFYELREECKMPVSMIVMGFMGLHDVLNKKDGGDSDGGKS